MSRRQARPNFCTSAIGLRLRIQPKSELRVPKFNEPVDYAFFSSKEKTDTPILLLEAKRLGSDLAHKNHVKQLTAYLGATGVQWGVLSDGNRYVLYNSRGGTSFEEQKFLTLEIKTVNTDSGFTLEEFLKHLTTLLSRECLENEEIQQAYEEHMINSRIRLALDSLLSTPFATLMAAIRRVNAGHPPPAFSSSSVSRGGDDEITARSDRASTTRPGLDDFDERLAAFERAHDGG